jgi:2-iminobutanoate/2-iminopropanoate deaminase
MHDIIEGPDIPVYGPYSPAIRVGDLIFISAQPGIDPATGQPPEPATAGDGPETPAAAECRQALRNLARILEASGSDLAHVVRTTLFYAEFDDVPALNHVYREVFGDRPPARTAARVGLPGGRLVAIDAIAAAPASQ